MKRSTIQITPIADRWNVDTERGEAIGQIAWDSEIGQYSLNRSGDCPDLSEADLAKVLQFMRERRRVR